MIRIIILILLFIINSMSAQEFQGVVTYKTDRKLEIKIDSTQAGFDMQQQIQEMMRKQFQKDFTLRFNMKESIYKEEKSLGAPQPAGVQIVMVGGGGESDELYKNIKEERYSSQRDLMGKTFLVKDELKKLEWKLEDETKKIGNYTCYKATAKRMISTLSGFTEDEDDQEEPEEREITITAWYTPEIPISNGPENYWGLPGLILETNDGQQSILCSKIVLNAKKKIEISEPTKGKVVTENKFETIMQKKMKEMRDRMPRRGDGDGFQLRIGG
ncbi:GLPGLI family protein [Aquimarina sp. 2201CG5-10]|uniref:GLPGLI family protein n=1 Tax=Aquimarina callyspongiae TaxID=3098150 RepID=UPI002AB38307|nr:GLPGLI family protein [Aquimarina sp. 2201CG5-10]MDY8136546.1 GLPGLI family protein [Aquimarina sp. 2201CG5-10]